MIMHRHTKKKTKRKRNTEEVEIEPHRIPQNFLSRHREKVDVQNYIAHDEIPQTFLLTTRELTRINICGRIQWIFRPVFSVN